MLLSQDVAHRPIVFLRFNPDKYIDENGNKIESPWKHSRYGVTLKRATYKVEWNDRLSTLRQRFEYWLTHVPEKTITIEYLFYTKNINY